MDPTLNSDEARQTLNRLDERMRRDVSDMLNVLQADVPTQFVRAVRQAFERSDQVDGMVDELDSLRIALDEVGNDT